MFHLTCVSTSYSLPTISIVIFTSIKHPTSLMPGEWQRKKGEGQCFWVCFIFTQKCIFFLKEKPSRADFSSTLFSSQSNKQEFSGHSELPFLCRCTLLPSKQSCTYCLENTTRCIMAFLQPWIVLWAQATYTEL